MWTRGVAIGTFNDLNSVYMLNSGDVWAVGGGDSPTATCSTAPCPVIMHFTGGSWNTVTPPPGQYILNSVFMVSPSEGWAVGCSGTLVQCPRDAAETNPHPFAVGSAGIILHYTVTGGVGTWAIFPSPSTPPLNSVFMVSPNEGWIVGDGSDGPNPTSATVLHYTVTGGQGTWNAVTVAGLLPESNLNSVFMLSSTSGWAVGGITPGTCSADEPSGECSPTFFAGGPIIIHWDGAKWSQVATPELAGGGKPVLLSTYFTGSNDGWAVGTPGILTPTIFHWDGVRWTPITLSPALLGAAPPTIPPTLKSVYMIDPSNGWIVGTPIDFSQTTISKTPPPNNAPLATILQFEPFGGMGAPAVTTVTTISQVASGTITTTATATVTTTPTTIQINVKVVDSQGNPVQGATVAIPSLGLSGVTDSNGIVTFNVIPGTYSVTVTRAGTTSTVSISPSSNGQTFTLTLSGGGFGPSSGIPGFPVESVAAGLFLGLMALLLARRKRRSRV
jgi:photosystem II stability/assembly factor-like uncharacterized protein